MGISIPCGDIEYHITEDKNKQITVHQTHIHKEENYNKRGKSILEILNDQKKSSPRSIILKNLKITLDLKIEKNVGLKNMLLHNDKELELVNSFKSKLIGKLNQNSSEIRFRMKTLKEKSIKIENLNIELSRVLSLNSECEQKYNKIYNKNNETQKQIICENRHLIKELRRINSDLSKEFVNYKSENIKFKKINNKFKKILYGQSNKIKELENFKNSHDYLLVKNNSLQTKIIIINLKI